MTLKQNSNEINGLNAQNFLSLSTDFNNLDINNISKQNNISNINHYTLNNLLNQKSSNSFSRWFYSL